jgi:hypothetical protein
MRKGKMETEIRWGGDREDKRQRKIEIRHTHTPSQMNGERERLEESRQGRQRESWSEVDYWERETEGEIDHMLHENTHKKARKREKIHIT